jgi:radical SAM protein with 4Fe4S-binding SPASM domain
MGDHFSLILLPTLACNAECDYCFETRTDRRLSLDQLSELVRKVMDHLDRNRITSFSIYWQGGEVMTLPPRWFEDSLEIIQKIADENHKEVSHFLQSNMIAYGTQWNRVLAEMFGNSVGTSMDFPNLHRKLKSGGTSEYDRVWTRNIREARDAGIEVGVIAIPNEQTLDWGAERFYAHFVDDLGIRDFQINTPFPGGSLNAVKKGFPLDPHRLTRFFADLATIWFERGFEKGVTIGPLSKLVDYFLHGNKDFACIWRNNCVNDFVCIDPGGHVAQCDCWVTSYPEWRFGNVFAADSLTDLLRKSPARRSLQSRPGVLVQREDCLECDYLGICHGGCPVRAFTVYADVFRKDPYCELYRNLFQTAREMAVERPPGLDSTEGIGVH